MLCWRFQALYNIGSHLPFYLGLLTYSNSSHALVRSLVRTASCKTEQRAQSSAYCARLTTMLMHERSSANCSRDAAAAGKVRDGSTRSQCCQSRALACSVVLLSAVRRVPADSRPQPPPDIDRDNGDAYIRRIRRRWTVQALKDDRRNQLEYDSLSDG